MRAGEHGQAGERGWRGCRGVESGAARRALGVGKPILSFVSFSRLLSLLNLARRCTHPSPLTGAVIGLAALGHATVSLLLVPQLGPYMSRLSPLLQDSSNPLRRAEAYRVQGAIVDAVSGAMYERLLAAAAAGLPMPTPAPRCVGYSGWNWEGMGGGPNCI